jgi:hypothetical protein
MADAKAGLHPKTLVQRIYAARVARYKAWKLEHGARVEAALIECFDRSDREICDLDGWIEDPVSYTDVNNNSLDWFHFKQYCAEAKIYVEKQYSDDGLLTGLEFVMPKAKAPVDAKAKDGASASTSAGVSTSAGAEAEDAADSASAAANAGTAAGAEAEDAPASASAAANAGAEVDPGEPVKEEIPDVTIEMINKMGNLSIELKAEIYHLILRAQWKNLLQKCVERCKK